MPANMRGGRSTLFAGTGIIRISDNLFCVGRTEKLDVELYGLEKVGKLLYLDLQARSRRNFYSNLGRFPPLIRLRPNTLPAGGGLQG